MVVGSTIINDKIHITYSSPQKDAETVILYYIKIYIYMYWLDCPFLFFLVTIIIINYTMQIITTIINYRYQLSLSIIVINYYHYCNVITILTMMILCH
jgi:hypothetical protein